MLSNVNIFLVLNLGSEMLYVIDQRLRAQSIPLDKSARVIRDLCTVLFDTRFLDQLIETEATCGRPLSPTQIRLLLSDIACCSLMRLDPVSMDKLWDLMVVLFKWQLFVAQRDPHRLINITFKHLDGVGKMMPEMKKGILIDTVKMKILTLWDTGDDAGKLEVATTIYNWLHPFNVKISILMRLGLQDNCCNFIPIDLANKTHADLLANIGENIYKKYPKKVEEPLIVADNDEGQAAPLSVHRELFELADQLQITPLEQARSEPQESMLSLLDSLNIGGSSAAANDRQGQPSHEFVQIRNSHSCEEYIVDPDKISADPDLIALMKVPPHIPKY